ncbi:MAG: hypothetical protein OXG55_15500 [bacterium]|nr:hypothetical protein [bacterium]MCY3953403.1 hypothetical protein [bacterium]MCY4104640.1 hypothetical protein [bacterium]
MDVTITANTLDRYVPALRRAGDNLRLRIVLHDFGLVWQHADTEERRVLVATEPERFDTRWDAFLAAYTEHVCYHAGIPAPDWAFDPCRYLRDFWHPGEQFPSDRFWAVLTAPAAFEVHGIWLPERELQVV